MEKVLIIKTGYSEVLDSAQKNSMKTSLGDVLRTTPILHVYKNDDVTWLTDKEAFPLLEKIPYISHLLALDFTTAMNLFDEEFDTVINLEKNKDICKFSRKIDAWKRYGFRFDKKTDSSQAYDRALEVLTVSSDINAKKENSKYVQELLFEMIGAKWKGEEYILGYKPKTEETFDVGLNIFIGPKWPVKSWPIRNWDILEERLIQEGYKVTRQDRQGENVTKNLYGYIGWINSGRLIVSNDSLGLHLGIALGKKVIGLFGPTPNREVYFYNRGKAILPEINFECIPCLGETCSKEKRCIEYISPEMVYKEIKNLK